MQTLYNLNEDELSGFEEAWKGNARKHLPGWNEGLNMHDVSGFTRQYGLSSSRGGYALPSNERPHKTRSMRSGPVEREQALLVHSIQYGCEQILEIVQVFLVGDHGQTGRTVFDVFGSLPEPVVNDDFQRAGKNFLQARTQNQNGGNQSNNEHDSQRNLPFVTVTVAATILGFCPHVPNIATELERAHPPQLPENLLRPYPLRGVGFLRQREEGASWMSHIQQLMVEAEERAASSGNEPIPRITLGMLLQKLNSITHVFVVKISTSFFPFLVF
ncbi:glycine-rich protein [Actinidia rufa]|uniref:Glycine-rich protein n=1 Tax=Actinidia rufa TaxID=165716 RepID=A0A7J0FSQ2_9ERIC|nr:glycine-rich protein [Actinidia rufa]